MWPKQPIYKIFIPFIIGILAGFVATSSALIVFIAPIIFILLSSILVFLVLLKASKFQMRIETGLHRLTWFLSGVFAVFFANPSSDPKHFSNVEADYYEARIDQISVSNIKKSKFIRCELSVEYVYDITKKIASNGKILTYIDTAFWEDYKRNDVLLIHAVPEKIINQGNPGEFNVSAFWKNKGFEYQWFLSEGDFTLIQSGKNDVGFFERIRSSFTQQLSSNLEGDVFAVAMGVLLGDKNYMNLELKDAFSGAGAMHLLAVSGLHVGIFLVILQWLFQRFGTFLPRWIRFAIIVGILWMYAGITGFSPSVNRAVTMFSFVALGTLIGRRYNPLDGLFASAMLLLIIHPNNLFDIGFQLSYLALMGIFLLSPILERSLYIKNKVLKFIWSGTSVALAAQLATFPITLYYFHQFPNYFLLTNLGLMIISGVLMAIGLSLVALGSIPYVGILISGLFMLVVTVLIAFIQWVSDLPFAITQGFRIDIWEVMLLYVGICLLLFALFHKSKNLMYCSASTFIFFVCFQVFQTIKDAKTQELIVMNSNDPAVFLRRGNTADLFVFSNKEDIESRFSFIKRSLDVYYGVNTKLNILNKKYGTYYLKPLSVELESKAGAINITTSKHKISLLYGDYFKERDIEQSEQLVLGPWINSESVEKFEDRKAIWSLKEFGAYRIDL